jgi:hypothetical protein
MTRYTCSVCGGQRSVATTIRPGCCFRKMNRMDEGRKRNIINMKPSGEVGQGGSAPNPHRCKLCGAYHSQHGIKAGKTTGWCHNCFANPPEENLCVETTLTGERCRRLGLKDDRCPYHYNLSQSVSSNSKSSSVSESDEAPSSSI